MGWGEGGLGSCPKRGPGQVGDMRLLARGLAPSPWGSVHIKIPTPEGSYVPPC